MFFVDTSALLAILDQGDMNHPQAEIAWRQYVLTGVALVTTSYIVVETTALVQRRMSLSAVKVLVEEILPVMSIEWVNQATHQE